jgi:hypothetical protein
LCMRWVMCTLCQSPECRAWHWWPDTTDRRHAVRSAPSRNAFMRGESASALCRSSTCRLLTVARKSMPAISAPRCGVRRVCHLDRLISYDTCSFSIEVSQAGRQRSSRCSASSAIRFSANPTRASSTTPSMTRSIANRSRPSIITGTKAATATNTTLARLAGTESHRDQRDPGKQCNLLQLVE